MLACAMISEVVNRELSSWIERIQQNLERNRFGYRTNTSGTASKSLRVQHEKNRFRIKAVDYFPATERGYDGKNPPAPLNFQDKIYEWSKAKGIFFQSEANRISFAMAVSKSIEARGTKLYQSGGNKEIYTNVINEGLPLLEQKLRKEFSKQIKLIIDGRNNDI